MAVFALSWGTTALGYTRQQFLLIQLFGILFFALTIPLSAVFADRYGRRRTLIWATAAIAAFGFVLPPGLMAGTAGARGAGGVGGGAVGGADWAPPGPPFGAVPPAPPPPSAALPRQLGGGLS